MVLLWSMHFGYPNEEWVGCTCFYIQRVHLQNMRLKWLAAWLLVVHHLKFNQHFNLDRFYGRARFFHCQKPNELKTKIECLILHRHSWLFCLFNSESEGMKRRIKVGHRLLVKKIWPDAFNYESSKYNSKQHQITRMYNSKKQFK